MEISIPNKYTQAMNERVLENYRLKEYSSIAAGEHKRNSATSGDFYHPRSIAIDPETGYIYICDIGNNRVQIFTESLHFLYTFTEELDGPEGICIHLSRVYVTLQDPDCVNVYSTEGRFLKSVGRKGDKELEFHWPRGIAVSPDSIIYICDWANNRIQCLNTNLTFKSIISEIKGPRDVKLTSQHIIVLTEDNKCIQFYDYNHRITNEIVTRGKYSQVSRPYYFCVDSEYNIILSDQYASCITVFSSSGDLLHRREKKGDRRDVLQPMGVALDSQKRVVVATHNPKFCIQIFNYFAKYTSRAST